MNTGVNDGKRKGNTFAHLPDHIWLVVDDWDEHFELRDPHPCLVYEHVVSVL